MTDKISSAAITMVQNAALQMDPAKLASSAKDGGENDFQKLLEKKSRPVKVVDQDQDETGTEETTTALKRKRSLLLGKKLEMQPGELVQIVQFDMQPGIIPTPQPFQPKLEIMSAGELSQMLDRIYR